MCTNAKTSKYTLNVDTIFKEGILKLVLLRGEAHDYLRCSGNNT